MMETFLVSGNGMEHIVSAITGTRTVVVSAYSVSKLVKTRMKFSVTGIVQRSRRPPYARAEHMGNGRCEHSRDRTGDSPTLPYRCDLMRI